MKRLRLAVAAVLVLAPVLWGALHHVREREALRELLEAVARAHERTGYEGEAAWGDEWPGMWVVHDAKSGRTRYGWGRWSHVHAAPSGRMPDPAAFCRDVDALLENYRATEGEPGTYLGRNTRTLLVESRHEGRPRLEIVVDRATLLPLRVKTIRYDGKPLREAVFHSLSIGDRDVRPSFGAEWPGMGGSVAPDRLDEAAGFPVWRPDYLPAGFRLHDSVLSTWMGPCVRLLYTDGVTAFELWQRPVLTPAQVETFLARRRGPFPPAGEMRWIFRRAREAIVRSGGGRDGIATRCHEGGLHRFYELRVSDREVTLVSRADLDPEESLRVLRSLAIR